MKKSAFFINIGRGDTVIENDLIDELKKDYHYSLSNKKLIEGIVLDLFDTCFLAFDERENDK